MSASRPPTNDYHHYFYKESDRPNYEEKLRLIEDVELTFIRLRLWLWRSTHRKGITLRRTAKIVAIGTVVLAGLVSQADAVPSTWTQWLSAGDPTHANAYYTAGSGSIRARQTCVSGGHGATYYGPWMSSANVTSSVVVDCARSSISAWGVDLA